MNFIPLGGLSRRSVIRGAAVVVASLVVADLGTLTAPHAWAADSGSTEPPTATTTPVSIDEYVRVMPQSGDTSGISTLLAGVQEEYRRAVAIFPLTLPSGYVFPAESSITEPQGKSGVRFSVGTGAGEAYFFWQNATAAAAYSAHLRGDRRSSTELLGAIANGYSTPVRKMYIQDPDERYVTSSINPARNGNFISLRAQGVDQFLANSSARAIATKAGDTF